jgi:histidine ammonia-lyase
VEFRVEHRTSAPLQAVVARLRQDCAALEDDRYMADDLAAAAELVSSAAITNAAGLAAHLVLGAA